jgi:hypothetical protein
MGHVCLMAETIEEALAGIEKLKTTVSPKA